MEPDDATLIGGEAATQARRLVPGTVFAGRYRIERVLGRGGMGAVYLAHDEKVGDHVALKTMTLDTSPPATSPDLPGSPASTAAERFAREVRLARKITHPNVARTFDLGESDGLTYLTMEYVEGEGLDRLLARVGKLPAGDALRIVLSICAGLDAAHQAGVIHRDLKPSNVMLTESGRVVLLDFGIARAQDGSAEAKAHRDTVGAIGTPLYMAPEQIAGLPIDARTDLYALGLISFELTTGSLPAAKEGGHAGLMAAVARMTEPAPTPQALPHVPVEFAALICACLAPAPADRPASAFDLAEALVALEGDWIPAGGSLSPRGLGASSPLLSGARWQSPGGSVADLTGTRATRTPATATTTASGTTNSASTTGPATTLSTGPRRLAVLPFRFRGPADDAYLGEALAEELVDVLSRTQGIEVLASAATARFGDDRDPKRVGEALGATIVVDGTIQAGGGLLRVTVRMVDAEGGRQLWSDRVDGRFDDVFALQDLVGRRIAEGLRLELATVAHRGDAPPEASELYLRARQRLARMQILGPDDAVELFERALHLAPNFKPAISGFALACIRAWFSIHTSPTDRDWAKESEAAVTRALAEAPDIAETHLAAAMLHTHRLEVEQTMAALSRALRIAPTFALAHQYLGSLQLEVDRISSALEHIDTALSLDPSLVNARFDRARAHALLGDHERAKAFVMDLEEAAGAQTLTVQQFKLRLAAWRGDTAELQRGIARLETSADPVAMFATAYARAVLGLPFTIPNADAIVAAASPRLRLVIEQNAVEALAAAGQTVEALTLAEDMATRGLLDLSWLDRCPLLAPLRPDPRFLRLRGEVATRVRALEVV
jgi:serine/threonine protein kinase/tetratricopeptide (TPR) repeat protein